MNRFKLINYWSNNKILVKPHLKSGTMRCAIAATLQESIKGGAVRR